MFFFPLNVIFDTELVHLYLSDSVQMSITYHYDPEMMSITMDIRGPKKKLGISSHDAPLGASPPVSLYPTNAPAVNTKRFLCIYLH